MVLRFRIAWVTFFIALILLALLAVQVFWIRTSFDLKEQELYHKLDQEFTDVAKKVEDNTICFNLYAKSYFKPGEGIYMLKHRWKDDRFMSDPGSVDTINLFNIFKKRLGGDTMYTDPALMFSYPVTMDVSLRFQFQLGDTLAATQGHENSYNTKDITLQNYKERLGSRKNPEKLLDLHLLDSLVKDVLISHELPANFEMGFKLTESNQYTYLAPGSQPAHLDSSRFSIKMLSNTTLEDPVQLRLFIPSPFRVVLKSMMAMLISSALIVVTLVLLFIYFMVTILRQKKYNQMKTDFISNMTHEFKTPLTNIALALENMDQNPKQVENYLRVIAQENGHMQDNVERILQISQLEKKELNMRMEDVDMHDLLQRVARTFDMQLDQIGAKVTFHLNSPGSMVKGDETHLINVFYNLLDNAIKYRSHRTLEIQIQTQIERNKKNLIIFVSDNGIGMSKDVVKKVFEEFYRGSSGNVHDIKGFGLGLGYVKHVMEVHGGTVTVQSEPGSGSTFRLQLPVV